MISVIIPCLNESARIASVVQLALASPLTSEVLVIDDGSTDGTPEIARNAGARVITSTMLGKGASMEDGVRAAQYPLCVFLDGDLAGLRRDLIEVLAAPFDDPSVDMVKARFSRDAGRVTILTARPLIQTFFPELARFAQPLGGIIAARTDLLRQLHFDTDYGVDLGLLIDVHMRGANIVEVDIGRLEHDSQSLEALGRMAKQVVRTLLNRAALHQRFSLQHVKEAEEADRDSPSLTSLGTGENLALFDIDGGLIDGRFDEALAAATNRHSRLRPWLDRFDLTAAQRNRHIAAVFAGVRKEAFVETARDVALQPGAAESIIGLRCAGQRVGVISDNYRVAAETIRRRVFADFSLSHQMRFRSGLATGEIEPTLLPHHPEARPEYALCKHNVLLHLGAS